MQPKQMGSFIAALRKANGITQKQLAEHLAVSDKSVSRWECGEGLPDLALVPVIAEFFGITCDELLMGARNVQQTKDVAASTSSPRGEKQQQYLVKKTLFAFKNRSVIAYGVLAVGVFGAILVNCGFLRALIAFFVGVIFCAVAGLCMAYFARSALHQLDTDVLEDEAVRAARLQVFNTSKRFLQVELLCFAGVLLPLIAFVQSAYQGLHYDSVLGECAVFVLVAQLVFFGVCEPLVWRKAAHCGAGVPEENPMKTLLQRAHWRVRASALCACLCVVLGAAHIVYLEMGATMFIEPLLFYDEETFVDFMGEQGEEEQALSFDESIAYGSATLPDICEINAPDGTVLFTYVARNTDVTNVSYGFVGDEIDPFPIRVTLDSMLTSARAKHVKGNLVYVMLYPCMVGLSALYYLCVRKREVPPPESV